MNTPSDKSITAAKSPDAEPESGELTKQQLDEVTGGLAKAGIAGVKRASGISMNDESPKETVTFEYGGLQVIYSQQKPDGS
jgi:hypothetical protein